jgi:hypothetical protein
MKALYLSAVLLLGAISALSAQTPIKIIQSENNTGVIDHGEQHGIRVGDVFEVNRYSGEFVVWIGRVEVVVVKAKIAGVKVIEQSGANTIQKGDVLEPRKREFDPLQDKLTQSAAVGENSAAQESARQGKNGVRNFSPKFSSRLTALQFGVTAGLAQSLGGSSASFGQNLTEVEIRNQQTGGLMRRLDMRRVYTTSLAFQAFCALPLSGPLSVNLNCAYIPLNVKSDIESALLEFGVTASASLIQLTGDLSYRYNDRWQFSAGIGVFLPHLSIDGGRQSGLIVSDRHFGFSAGAAYFWPIGSRIWLRSALGYNIFLDDGPAIQSLTLQTGPSFAIGKP